MSKTEEIDRFAIIADASRRLSGSLDYETTLATVAAMPLPFRDAWAIVDVLSDDGSIRRLPVHHPDPTKQAVLRELHNHYPPNPGTSNGFAEAIRTGRTVVEVDVSDDVLATLARDDEHLSRLRELNVHSFVSVPMVARGSVIGAVTVVISEDAPRIRDVDVALAEDLASRAAMAIDNAKLHREVSTARLVTESAMEAAEEAGRRKSEFLATMSHEFRTPLNAILGYSQILDMGVLGPTTPAQHSHLERLQASARHLLQLVDDVLDVAKVDADRLDVRQESLVTGASVVAAVTLVHPQATAKGIRLIDLGAASPGAPYLGDERRVRQILVNLLSNAVKFTPSGGEVSVNCGSTSEPDPGAQLPGGAIVPSASEAPDEGRTWAFIRVSDTGPGIAPEFMSRLFEPFVQADGALTREKGGTGLGLAISRRLARRMGGDLTARSREGSGATFTLWLPTHEKASTAAPAPASTPTARKTPLSSAPVVSPNGTYLEKEAYDVLYAIGTKLARDAEIVSERYVQAVRDDGRFPGARGLHDAQIRDHASPFIGLLASQLTALGETSGQDPELLADGGHVQRLFAELHGAQRHRLGWNEADIERETKILGIEVERAINASVDTETTAEAAIAAGSEQVRESLSKDALVAGRQYALDVAYRVLEQASRTALRTFRFAKNADAP